MKEKKLSRRERARLKQRREMLDAALALFSEKGFHNVSMLEIATTAEFAVGTLYKFFRNKEALYKALIMENADRFHDALTEALEKTDDEIEKLRNYVSAKSLVFMDNVMLIRLYFAETRGASFNIKAGLDDTIRKRHRQFMKTLASVFEVGMEKKRFRRISSPHHLAVALDSICNSFLIQWMESPDENPYPENPDVILNILFKGLID